MIQKHKKKLIILIIFYFIIILPVKIFKLNKPNKNFDSINQQSYDSSLGGEEQEESKQFEENDLEADNDNKLDEIENEEIVVDLRGAVAKPGIYHLPSNTRLYQLIEKAGGFLDANLECINQAEILTDESLIYIFNKDEKCPEGSIDDVTTSSPTKININRATPEELSQLPGIGLTRAQDIVNYRETNGSFKKIEDLLNVSGIGESTFSKLSELISV